MNSSKIVVSGDIRKAPLLVTDEARTIEFYDVHGELCAIFTRSFGDKLWVFSTKNDDDFEQVVTRAGLTLQGAAISGG